MRALARLGQGMHFHDVFRAAPAMAFHFFLSLLPLLVFTGYVIGLVAKKKGASAVLGLVLDNLPATTETVLKSEVGRLAGADRLGPLAAIGFLWIASGGVQGLMVAVETVVGAPRRVWWKQRLIAVGWVLATLLVGGIVAFGVIEWDEVVHAPAAAETASASAEEPPPPRKPASTNDPHVKPKAKTSTLPSLPAARPRARKILRGGAERFLALGFSLASAVGGLAAFYRFAVSVRRVRRRVLPGAVLAVALWIVVSWAFSLYLRTLASYAVYYGGLAAVAVLLVWLWLVSLAILVGAELNAQLEGLRDELVRGADAS